MSEEKSREQLAIKFAENRIKECLENPALVDDPITTMSALLWWHNFPSHQCYWNDRFCVAVICGLESRQRLAAWCIVSNGENGYFEWETHYKYNMVEALRRIGVVGNNFIPPNDLAGYYFHLSPDIAKAIIQKFDLPTRKFDYKQYFSDKEKQERGYFNQVYPYNKIL